MKSKFKSGAASFYVVAFSTLILVIIAASFATAIIAEITRASNDDLSQSAYDAALAGVEDAKLAFMNYKNCVKSGVTISEDYRPAEGSTEITCKDIIYWIENPDCDMVAHILGRISSDDSGEVLVEETDNNSNEMNQAYTCAKIETNLDDYRASLSSSDPYKVVKVDLDGVAASEIASVRVSWYSNSDNLQLQYSNIRGSNVAFRPITDVNVAVPPTLAVQLIQTAGEFSLGDLNGMSNGNLTDRATVYLVPTDSSELAAVRNDSYEGIYKDGDNILNADQIASTNNHKKNLPYVTYCPYGSSNYLCSAMLNLPSPINGSRNDETFMFIVSLPYGQPDTDFSLEFFCGEGRPCGKAEAEEGVQNIARQNGVQVMIDSTGRANDLYRRVEVRLESTEDINASALSLYGVQALDDKDSVAIDKSKIVTTEYGL